MRVRSDAEVNTALPGVGLAALSPPAARWALGHDAGASWAQPGGSVLRLWELSPERGTLCLRKKTVRI